MAAKKNGPGNNKAYMPVPKGYKGNWNVPKGTPWKKDSPYNPANKNKGPTSRSASPESVVAAKKAAAASSSSRVVSRSSSPAAIGTAKAKAASRVSASVKASDNKMMTMAKQGRKASAARTAAAKAAPSPSDRRGSMDNIKRAAQANRASQSATAKKQASSPTSRVTKKPAGYKQAGPPAGNKNYR